MSRSTMVYGSTEFRRVLVTVTEDDGTPIDPTVYDVQLAFMPGGTVKPAEADWHDATWVTVGSSYYARILVGPDGGLDLPESDYFVYVRIEAGEEFPYMLSGVLSFY